MIIHYEPKRLTEAYDPVDMQWYKCPHCGLEMPVAVLYDPQLKWFYPADYKDTICAECGSEMEKAKPCVGSTRKPLGRDRESSVKSASQGLKKEGE